MTAGDTSAISQGVGAFASRQAINAGSSALMAGEHVRNQIVVLAARVLPDSAWAQTPVVRTKADTSPLNPSVYLGIEPDGTVRSWLSRGRAQLAGCFEEVAQHG